MDVLLALALLDGGHTGVEDWRSLLKAPRCHAQFPHTAMLCAARAIIHGRGCQDLDEKQ
jgi:hypothetical protein